MKIYARERTKVGRGVKEPRFRIVAILREPGEAEARIDATHFRKMELETLAKDIGAEIRYLEPMPDEEKGRMKGR
jgi:hypothetical protein